LKAGLNLLTNRVDRLRRLIHCNLLPFPKALDESPF